MPNFLITYHGGSGMPATPEARDQMMAAFGAWVASVGENMVDPGAPLSPAAMVVSSDGVRDGSSDAAIGGYSIISADDVDAAVAMVKEHPFVGRGGSLRVAEAVAP